MPKISGCSQLFECGYYYDAGFHPDNTDHVIPKGHTAPKPKEDDPKECPNKLDVEKLFGTNCQSTMQEETELL